MWLARNPNGKLLAFNDKPELNIDNRFQASEHRYYDEVLYLSENEFPEVRFENSPIEVVSLNELKEN